MRPYIGLTGFTATDEVAVAMNHLNSRPHKFGPYQLMIGVLANLDTINGRLSKQSVQRYPEPARTARLFPDSTEVLNLYHYSTPTQQFLPELKKLIQFGGKNLHGFQLNLAWPDPSELQAFRDKGNEHIIVQQIGSNAFDRIDNDPKKLVKKIKAEYIDLVDYILLDPSGGKREELKVEVMRGYLRELYDSGVNDRLMIGFAGGISPYNPDRIVIPLITEFDGLSMDLEGSIRDPETDELLFTEMSKFLTVAYHTIVKRQLPPEPQDETTNDSDPDDCYQSWIDAGMPMDWFFN